MWNQFRRLILGTVLELLLEEQVPVDFTTVQIRFDESRSAFKVPRLDNYMRFVGTLTANLTRPFSASDLPRIQKRLLEAWPDLCGVLKIPVGDRLEPTINRIELRLDGNRLELSFDLEAD
jgi:hypothetical protein